MPRLPDEVKRFIVDKASKGFEPDEIYYMLRHENETPVSEQSVMDWLATDEAADEIRMRQKIRAKKADVQEDELKEDLVTLKAEIQERIEILHEQDLDTISSDHIRNLLETIDKLGEWIEALDRKGTSETNVVKINEVEQHIEHNPMLVIKQLPEKQQRDLLYDLSDELGLVVKKKRKQSNSDDDDDD